MSNITFIGDAHGKISQLQAIHAKLPAEDGLDVSEIAKRYGGGGHPHASGFRMPLGWEGDSQT